MFQIITVSKGTGLGLNIVGGINRNEGPLVYILEVIPGGDCHKVHKGEKDFLCSYLSHMQCNVFSLLSIISIAIVIQNQGFFGETQEAPTLISF